jgi:hypothetical protein
VITRTCHALLLASLFVVRAGAVELIVKTGEPGQREALNIGLVVFDPGLAEDTAAARKLGIFPEIRNAEAHYLPYAIRRTLVDSNHWGAVRVLPEPDKSTELLITGRIEQSDGATLSITVTASDSSGRVWTHRIYSATAAENAFQAAQRRSRRPFQDLYNEIVNDLLSFRQTLSPSDLQDIRRVAELRYAGALAPDAFGDFLSVNEQGFYSVRRLPAHNDPMLDRVQRIREQEYLFIDTADDQFAELYTEMTPVYDLWRQFQREQMQYRTAHEARLADREKPRKGSYQAYKQSYGGFKWAKIQGQEMKLLAQGFNNEIAPTTMEIEGTVVKLNGSLDERYREWRRILREIYNLETGG